MAPRVQLLGSLLLANGAEARRPAWSRKAQALLGYLVRRDQPLSRGHLAGLLWGELPEGRGRRNLTRELGALAAALGGCIHGDYHTVQWQPGEQVWVDASALAHLLPPLSGSRPLRATNDTGPGESPTLQSDVAIAASRLAEAVALYQGEFLADLVLDDCPEFEAWLTQERESMRRQVIAALDQLVSFHGLRREDDLAQHYARRWLELEQTAEDVHRALMALLARTGQRGAALAQFETCRRILADDLGVQPAPETTELCEQIRCGALVDLAPAPAVERPAPEIAARLSRVPPILAAAAGNAWGDAPEANAFYGRDDELATLTRWLGEAGCRIVAILGMGGMGKTALAARIARQLAPAYDEALWLSLLNAPPLTTLLRTVLIALSSQQILDPSEQLDEQLAQLGALLSERRCLLVLDNCESILQGGTRAGAYRPGYEAYRQLVQLVARRAHQSSLLLTSRELPHGIALLQTETARVQSLYLAGLTPIGSRAVLHACGLTLDTAAATALSERYSGNPLALKIAAQTVQELFDGDVAGLGRDDALLFDDIRDVLDQQWARLTELEQDLLLWLALAREPLPLSTLQARLTPAREPQALIEAALSLRRRSLVEQQRAGLALHNVVAEYTIARLVDLICAEVESGAWRHLIRHPLLLAQSPEEARESQRRLILAPVADRLAASYGRAGLKQRLLAGLQTIQARNPRASGYAGSTALHLLLQLGIDLHGADFSGLNIWQAYLATARLPEVSFAHTDLSGSVFSGDFRAHDPVAWSPDGVLLAAATGSGQIHIWRVADLQLAGRCSGHQGCIWSLAFSPDGRQLASAGADQTVRVWDVRLFAPVATLRGHTRGVSAVAWSPGGVTLLSASWDQTIRLWDVRRQTARAILCGHTGGVRCLSLSRDGRFLASGADDQTVRIWDMASQTVVRILDHPAWVTAVAYHPDGNHLASGCFNQTLWLWDLPTGERRSLEGSSNKLQSVAFSPDGATLASSGDELVRLWDVQSGQARAALRGHTPWVSAGVWNPDGRRIASIGGNHIRIWDVAAQQTLATLHGYSDEVLSVAWSPDGAVCASSHADHIIRLWDTARWEVFATLVGHTNHVTNLLFSADGATLLSGSWDQTIRYWRVRSGEQQRVLRGHERALYILALSGDGVLLASGSQDATVWVWDAAQGQPRHILRGHQGEVASLAFHPAGAMLASGGEDGTIRFWDTATGQALATVAAHAHMVHWLLFDHSGARLVSASEDTTIKVWDTGTRRVQRTLVGHASVVCELALSPDGTTLASCGAADQTVRLWDLESGALRQTLHHPDWVVTLDFSPDGATLVSGSQDGTLRLWDVPSGVCRRAVRAPGPYGGMNIAHVTGVTAAQREALRALGAVDEVYATLSCPPRSSQVGM